MRKNHIPRLGRLMLAISLSPLIPSTSTAADWKVKEAPYRATLKMTSPGNDATAGVEIEMPDFGAHRADLGDATLINSAGESIPLQPVWHAVGGKAIFLAQQMQPQKEYFLYFGGKLPQRAAGWKPKQGLILETRTLGANPGINTESEMLNTWNGCSSVNGIGYVDSISTTGNPFGESTNFASHYTGLYLSKTGEELTFYTLSSDASFVLADGRTIVEYPNMHGAGGDEKHVHKGSIVAASDVVKIDYYQAKVGDGVGASFLGVFKDGSYKPIPSDSWVHPGKSRLEKIEQLGGLPVPSPSISYDSYMGYGGAWLYQVAFDAPRDAPEGWLPEWHFSDGAVIQGSHCERILPLGKPQSVTLAYRKGDQIVQGVAQIAYPENLSAASVKDPDDLNRYLHLISEEKPENLPASSLEAMLPLLLEYANNDITGRFAKAWLLKNPQSTNPLWIHAVLSSIMGTAQTDPKQALLELRGIDRNLRKQHSSELSMLELELLVFYLRDPSAKTVAESIAFDFSGKPEAQRALIRLGDYYRLSGQSEKAEAQYALVQKEIPDETGGRKLPAMDRAYSITVENLLANGMRHEAEAKLREWELVHPLCKRDSDFLLLQARLFNSYGYWSQALAELDSFKKNHLESPYEITADFYRAASLDGLGKKDEARQIRASIVKNYPKHELAEQCRQLLAKP